MAFDLPTHTGLSYGEKIPVIESAVTEAEFAGYCQKVQEQFTALAKQWSPELNTEWFARHYLAMKMLLSASVMMTSSRYATKKNLKIVEPYLLYYATLSCCRAVVFTVPEQVWDDRLHKMSHSKTLNVAADAIRRLSKSLATEVDVTSRTAQGQREMHSYRFPAKGIPPLEPPADFDSVRRVCRLLGEVAQLRSEILQAAIEKHAGELPPLDVDALRRCFEYSSFSGTFFDDDDLHRVAFWKRQNAGPFNLNLLATVGLVEDYFGSWAVDEEEASPDVYEPDDWRIIFPFR